MSVIKVTKADLMHVSFVIQLTRWIFDTYPELFGKLEEDELLIVEQLLKEKLYENTDI